MAKLTTRQRAIQDVLDLMHDHDVVMLGSKALREHWQAFVISNGLTVPAETDTQTQITRDIGDSVIFRPLAQNGRAQKLFWSE